MGRKHIDATLRASPAIEEARAKFKPQFGDLRHMQMMRMYEEILHTKTFLAKGLERSRELKRITTATKAHQEKLKELEKALLWMLEQELSPPSTGLST